MTTVETIEQVEWAKLRPRSTEPPCVIASIPPEDVHKFLRLLAANPLEPFNDAVAMLNLARSVRLSIISNRLECKSPSKEYKDSTKDKFESLTFSEDAFADEDIRGIDGNTDIPARGGSRKRGRRAVRGQFNSRKSGAKDVERNASRNVLSPRTKSDSVKIGPDHQADVPHTSCILAWDSVPDSQRVIGSCLVFSPEVVGGEATVDAFFSSLNASLLRRDGFAASPLKQEKALSVLMENHEDLERGRRLALMNMSQEAQYPAAGSKWSNEEQCRLARAFAEGNRNFENLSRTTFRNRTTKELVVHYYTKYKQQWLQGEKRHGLMFDRGIEPPASSHAGAEVIVNYLRYLAVTAGDGFPPERRMRDVISRARAQIVRAASSPGMSNVPPKDDDVRRN